jgi:hypothetical protein
MTWTHVREADRQAHAFKYEISHVTVPVADGGVGIPSFFDIPGSPPPKSFRRTEGKSLRHCP